MGGGDIDDFEEGSHKLKIVSCGVEKFAIFSYLIRCVSIVKYRRVV